MTRTMNHLNHRWAAAACIVLGGVGLVLGADQGTPRPQYAHESLRVPPAAADEPVRATFSLDAALKYLDDGAVAWSRERKCVSCHTNGAYLAYRPALTSVAGEPLRSVRDFFVEQLASMESTEQEKLLRTFRPAQVAFVAAGLAEWDAHVHGKRTAETDRALRLLFQLQLADGSFGNADCWPPFESSSYQAATVAAMAAATAPGWTTDVRDEASRAGFKKLKQYLRTTPPPHDYGSLLLLWTATRVPDLLDEPRRASLVADVFRLQNPDGGWSIRSFAAPEAWGKGNRAAKLREEADLDHPPSDGHQTGLCVLVLREAGVPADDQRLQASVGWLLANQRESGRWWTRSLNTDNFHFITYSGTCYALLALAKCHAIAGPGG